MAAIVACLVRISHGARDSTGFGKQLVEHQCPSFPHRQRGAAVANTLALYMHGRTPLARASPQQIKVRRTFVGRGAKPLEHRLANNALEAFNTEPTSRSIPSTPSP